MLSENDSQNIIMLMIKRHAPLLEFENLLI